MSRLMDGFLTGLLRRPTAWAAALLPLLLAVAATVLLGQASRTPSSLDSLPKDAESTVAASLQQQLPDDAAPAVVLFPADTGALPADARGSLQAVVDQVTATMSLPPGPPVTLSE